MGSSVVQVRVPSGVSLRDVGRASVLRMVVAILACRLAIAVIVIPPWQNPDEPAHVERMRQIANQPAGELTAVDTNRDIVESMRRYDWWRHYGRPIPDPLPNSAADVSSAVDGGPAVYYVVSGWVLTVLGIAGALPQLYFLRAISAVFGILTLWCAWRGTRLILAEHEALVVPAVLSLHPQFAIVSTTVSPDAVINFLGAVVWWQGMRVVTEPGNIAALLICWSAGGLAPFIRRSGFAVLAMALATWVCSLAGAARRGRRHAFVNVRSAITAVALVSGVILTVRSEAARILNWTLPSFDRGFIGEPDLEFFKAFSSALFDNSWLLVGWARYLPPPPWILTARLISLAAVIGLLVACCRRDRRHFPRLLIATTAALAILQVIAVYAWFFRLHIGPQGRFLFPAVVPFTVLLCIGWLALWPERRRNIGAVTLIALIATLDFFAWTMVVIPAYG